MKPLFLVSIFFAFLSCNSSKNTITHRDIAVTANETRYMKMITVQNLKKQLYTIASDSMEGRDTGTPGQKKAARYIVDQYIKRNIPFPKGAHNYYQKVPATFMIQPFGPALADSENIWAFIEGTEKPDEILVISAHYDHVGIQYGTIYNGADDNASGTAAILEIANAFMQAKKDGYGPKRSILFLHITGEENGLHGSRYYSEHPLFPLKNTIANLNIDMIGRRDNKHKKQPDYIYLIGSNRLSTELHTISEQANTKYIQLELDYKYNAIDDPEQIYYRSDHYNFAKNDIPSLFYFNGIHEDYHLPGDTADKIEYNLLQKRTQLVFVTAWELANRENRPVVDKKTGVLKKTKKKI